MDRIAALPTGTKLVLGAGALLFIDLFLTWQTIELEFGPTRTITSGLDGWDFWGLLIGLLTLALLAFVIVREMDSEIVLEGRWDLVPLGLTGTILLLTIVKNVRDADSTWASYLGIVLALVAAVGAYLDWSRSRSDEIPVHSAWRAQPAGPTESPMVSSDPDSDETAARW